MPNKQTIRATGCGLFRLISLHEQLEGQLSTKPLKPSAARHCAALIHSAIRHPSLRKIDARSTPRTLTVTNLPSTLLVLIRTDNRNGAKPCWQFAFPETGTRTPRKSRFGKNCAFARSRFHIQSAGYEREPPYRTDEPDAALRERHPSTFIRKTFGHFNVFDPKRSQTPAISLVLRALHFVTPCYTKIFKKILSPRPKRSRNPLASAPCNPTFSRHVERNRPPN